MDLDSDAKTGSTDKKFREKKNESLIQVCNFPAHHCFQPHVTVAIERSGISEAMGGDAGQVSVQAGKGRVGTHGDFAGV